MIAVWIIGTLLSVVMLIYGFVLVYDDKGIGIILILLSVILIGICITNTIVEIHSIPKAIDVYRGKTTLKITYRNSVAIDSTVVYKVR